MKCGPHARCFTRRLVVAGLISLSAAEVACADQRVGVAEKAVAIKTPDGSAEAALFYPTGRGEWPAVLFWPDYAGLRPLYRDMARRFAAEGFVVLVPNTFYRSTRASESAIDPNNPAIHPMLVKYRTDATDAGIASDALAYFSFLDAQHQTDRKRKAGTVGYELGGSYAFRTAAALPGRVAAIGSIYGLSVATERADSPHLLVPKTKATFYVAIAKDHDAREPNDKLDIMTIIQSAKLQGTVVVYPAAQGWANPASKTYDAAEAERAFQALLALCKTALK